MVAHALCSAHDSNGCLMGKAVNGCCTEANFVSGLSANLCAVRVHHGVIARKDYHIRLVPTKLFEEPFVVG